MPATYSYLLGLYLGDGWVGPQGCTARLTISLDAAYPAIVDEAVAAIESVLPTANVKRLRDPHKRLTSVYSYAPGWLEMFPQYGPGRKHERAIELESWQQEIVDDHPQPLLRGLVHSDGRRVINRFDTLLPSGRVAAYEYPRYFFSNLSPDIRGMFCDTCDLLGIWWTRSNHRNISVSHRRSVARLDEFIGPKV